MSLTRRDLLLTAAATLPAALLDRGQEARAAASPATDSAAAAWSPPKCSFKTVENEWIPLKDGTRLAARLWIPEMEGGARTPVVLEYLPYRKRDVTRRANDATGEKLAQHGIGYARRHPRLGRF
jgi:predicted acyl esterase